MLRLLTLTIIFTLLISVPTLGQHISPEGTYDVWICNAPCEIADSSRALVSGQLILDSAVSPIPDDVVKFLTRRSSFLLGDEEANACFVLEKHLENTGIFTGIIPVALTYWQSTLVAESDTEITDLSIRLYGSPDASSVFDLFASDSELEGIGKDIHGEFHLVEADSTSLDGLKETITVDVKRNEGGYLIAHRVGPADFELCWDAVREQ